MFRGQSPTVVDLNPDRPAATSASATMAMKAAAASILNYTDEKMRKTVPAFGPALQPAASTSSS
jgi:hypothetical protein